MQGQIAALLCALCSLKLTTQAFAPALQNQARLFKSKIHSTAETVSEGLLKTVTKPGKGMPVELGDIATVKYSCYLPTEPMTAPFSKANQQRVVRGHIFLRGGRFNGMNE